MNRKLPEEVVIQTLFGPAVANKICNTCKIEKFIHEYFCESVSKRKKIPTISSQVRNQCKDCYNIFKGKIVN